MATDKLTTAIGKQLYRVLPEVYRTRDGEETGGQEDLARFLDACGELLDRIRATLDQRLADSFPDNPPAGTACQPWLIPYFAQLLDVRLVSPDEKGRRDEVANAVAWRQRKGTLTVIEQIAEAVGQMEAEVGEGAGGPPPLPASACRGFRPGRWGKNPPLMIFSGIPSGQPGIPTSQRPRRICATQPGPWKWPWPPVNFPQTPPRS
jgi:hypothetical protein